MSITGQSKRLPKVTDATLAIGKALIEWRDAGGSTTDVVLAIDDLIEARLAAHKSDEHDLTSENAK